MKKLFTLLLVLWAGISSAQVVSVPTAAEVERKVQDLDTKIEVLGKRIQFQLDSLAEVLRGETGNPDPKPTVPVPVECEHPVTLVEVYDVSQSGLWYNFYSVGVTNMKETIRTASGKVVLEHITAGLTRDRIFLQFNLDPGRYSLQIENADCDAKSQSVSFTIQGGGGGGQPIPDPVVPKPEPEPDPQPIHFENPGVYSLVQNGQVYEWIPSENVEVEISGGKVRIIAPETKQSRERGNTCRRFLVGDLFDNRLPEKEENALFGEGLELPVGNYEFKILYLNAKNWAEVEKNMWQLVGYDNHEHRAGFYNSAEVETLKLSITDGSPIQGIHSDQWRTSWIPQYQILPGKLTLPEGKAFGITRYLEGIPKDSIMSKITHIQHVYEWVWQYPLSKAWKNMQIFDGNGAVQMPDWHIRNAIMDPGYILMSEYAENYGNMFGCPPCYEKAEEIYEGIYKRFEQELGITSPSQTWLGADYFGPLWGVSSAIEVTNGLPKMYEGLSSIHFARSRLFNGQWYLSGYWERGYYKNRNLFVQGYIGNLLHNIGNQHLIGRIYNLEKSGLAAPDRRKIVYSTNAQEGLHLDLATISGTWYRTKLKEGELLRLDGITNSFHTILSDAFYALLFGDAYIIWESNVPMNADPYTFGTSWFGGEDSWKTRWKPNGGEAKEYKEGVWGPPKTKAKGQFPEKPLTGDQGAWVGAKLYEKLGKVSELYWADYERDGIPIVAKRGQDGTSRANINGIQNLDQNNIVQVLEKKLPICLVVRSDNGKFLVFQDPFAGLTSKQLITVDGQNFLITGNRLQVHKLN